MNHIREIRIKRGMTQGELAKKCKTADPTIDQARISFLENGDVYPGEKLMAALCEALEVPEELIYDGVEAVFIPVAEVPHSEATMILANTLKWGKKHAMTRPELAEKLGWSDRMLRKNIERARQEGVAIANDQDGGGYYFPETREELERQYRQNENRAMAILRQQKHIRAALK